MTAKPTIAKLNIDTIGQADAVCDQHQIANPQLGDLLVFVLEGAIDVTIGENITHLGRGDALDTERLPSCSIEASERADLLIASQKPSPRP